MKPDVFYISPDDSPAKRRIMQDGLHLFATRGLSATSIRDIAAVTGYSNPALYKHFKSKDALAATLFERSYREMSRQIALAITPVEGFEAKFSAYVSAFANFFDTCPDAAIFVADNLPALWPQVAEGFHGQTIVTYTRELLRLGKTEGFVCDNISLPMQLILVTGTLSQTIRQLFLGELAGPASAHCGDLEKILRKGLA